MVSDASKSSGIILPVNVLTKIFALFCFFLFCFFRLALDNLPPDAAVEGEKNDDKVSLREASNAPPQNQQARTNRQVQRRTAEQYRKT